MQLLGQEYIYLAVLDASQDYNFPVVGWWLVVIAYGLPTNFVGMYGLVPGGGNNCVCSLCDESEESTVYLMACSWSREVYGSSPLLALAFQTLFLPVQVY